MSRNKYHNRIHLPRLAYRLAIGTIACIGLIKLAHMRNLRLEKGEQLKTIESEIFALRDEIDTLKLRKAAMEDRTAVKRRIGHEPTGLVDIEQGDVFNLPDPNATQAEEAPKVAQIEPQAAH